MNVTSIGYIHFSLWELRRYQLHFMPVQDLKYHELTEKIIGCAMKVHRYFGPGFPEIVYKRALMIELKKLAYYITRELKKILFTMPN